MSEIRILIRLCMRLLMVNRCPLNLLPLINHLLKLRSWNLINPRFTVPPEYHAPSTKALLKIWLPLLFKQGGRDSAAEHDGGKVVTVKLSDQSPSLHRSVASIKKRLCVVCHTLPPVDPDDNDEDQVCFVPKSENRDV
ncbi:hypothetical protein DM860_017531 [Cuscuta australis]|uniref:Uncharacterized protein n=1 Tax=Cuscuta australis TaxID=267555 RepID=A0A328DD29_9ASTE|nr:hypothetical protein DM860_017531 [Cuscuta australis]